MDKKQLSRVEIKDAGRGEVRAVFSTLNVKDLDGDVTLPGAFDGNGDLAISAYGHTSWQGALPVGMGSIREVGDEAVLNGKFFMDTTHGKDAFLTVKALADAGLGEWSYGYDVLKESFGEFNGDQVRFLEKLKVAEVSPVLQGAGIGTRTVSAKGRDGRPASSGGLGALKAHAAEITGREWDADAVVDGLKGASIADLRAVFAWVDIAADPEAKSSYRFPHHHGVGGPANVRAIVKQIAALNRDGGGIPEADRKAVYDHLATHLRDHGREPQEYRPAGGSIKNIDRLPALLDELGTLVKSLRDVGSSRQARGKSGLSSLTLEALGWAEEDLSRVLADVRALKNTPQEAAALEYARYIAQQHQRRSLTP